MTGREERFVRESVFGSYRSQFQIDRDRIIYSPYLARLTDVTQVRSVDGFLVHNRLTHSLKVAQIARRLAELVRIKQPELAETLGVDPDVAEAAGLSHDMGHPPFGHIAEEELNDLVRNDGKGPEDGYEGNAQSFRIIVRLSVGDTVPDDKAIPFLPGLNPTRATLNAVLKYPWFVSFRQGCMNCVRIAGKVVLLPGIRQGGRPCHEAKRGRSRWKKPKLALKNGGGIGKERLPSRTSCGRRLSRSPGRKASAGPRPN